jgi:hypothetical protein
MKRTYREAITEWIESKKHYNVRYLDFSEDKRRLATSFIMYGSQDDESFDVKMFSLGYRLVDKKISVSLDGDIVQAHLWDYPKKNKEPLFKTVLNLCGVEDTEHVNHVVIDISPAGFTVDVTYNATTPEGLFILGDDCIVQVTKKFKLVEVD